ncbi:21 kDa protein [Spatholobus suberectus]|nr:21 kDa protein [Spatholobus suberectus]
MVMAFLSHFSPYPIILSIFAKWTTGLPFLASLCAPHRLRSRRKPHEFHQVLLQRHPVPSPVRGVSLGLRLLHPAGPSAAGPDRPVPQPQQDGVHQGLRDQVQQVQGPQAEGIRRPERLRRGNQRRVDRLSRSLKELKLCKAKGEDFAWHISNVETWVSAALTDESTCGDGFAGKALNGKIKASIRARMLNVAQVTSNALSLINQYAAKH